MPELSTGKRHIGIPLIAVVALLCISCRDISAIGESAQPTSTGTDQRAELVNEMRRLGVLGPQVREWFVSPSGSESGKGTEVSPLDVTTVFSGGVAGLKPGDIVWLRGGRYAGAHTCRIQGSRELPIHFRQFPNERAVFDKGESSRDAGAIDVRGDNVWFWDIEVANSSPERGRLDGKGEMNPMRGSGINIYAANTKYINLIVRDNGHGFGLWNEEGGTEIYGCIIFNNGNNKKEHGVYGHNRSGSHLIRDNIIFNNAGYGLHLYANSTKSSVSGFDIEGNTVFNNGSLMNDDQVADQILVGGVRGVPAERVSLTANYVFNEPSASTSKNRGVRLGYEDAGNKDVRLIDNYIVSKVPLRILWWQSVEARGNTIISSGKNVDITEPESMKSRYAWESNRYFSLAKGQPDFLLNGAKLTFASWRAEKGFDRQSKHAASTPENAVFVRPNKYDHARAVITVFNWKRDGSVGVDLSHFLTKGESFEVRDVQDLFGDPLAEGQYDGSLIDLPMKLTKVVPPQGTVERLLAHSGLEFSVFVVSKKKAGGGRTASRK